MAGFAAALGPAGPGPWGLGWGPLGRGGGAGESPLVAGPPSPRLDRCAGPPEPAPGLAAPAQLCGGRLPVGGPLGGVGTPPQSPPLQQCPGAQRPLGAGGGVAGQGPVVLAGPGGGGPARRPGPGRAGQPGGHGPTGDGPAAVGLVPVALLQWARPGGLDRGQRRCGVDQPWPGCGCPAGASPGAQGSPWAR